MSDRDKLIELIKESVGGCATYWASLIADHLIANGVTVGKDADVPTKWIPVGERLPENDFEKHWKNRKHYLVCTEHGRTTVARFGSKEYPWWVDGHDSVVFRGNFGNVTHWMPLPEPPKGE